MSIGVDPNHTSIRQAILASLRHGIDDVHCKECKDNQTKTRWTEIVAAPKILRIHLQIIHHQHKIFHNLTHPDLLDLTAHQQDPTLPLQYQLSSIIAHNGDYYDEEEAGLMAALKLMEEQEKQEQIKDDHALALKLSGGGEDEDESEEATEEEEESDTDESGTDEDADEGDDTSAEHLEDTDSDLENLFRGTDDADSPAPTSPASSDLTELSDSDMKALERELHPPPKVMVGHYIASVRESNANAFSCINDSSVANISHQEFLTNPQDSNDQQFEVYVLTYLRDDSVRNMPAPIPERWSKEISQLTLGKGAIKPVVYPTIEPRQPEPPSRKRAVGQDRQQGTKQKRSKTS
jgi:hypothetical protein